jgi:hypothetical protein
VASYCRREELTEYQAAREELEKLIGEVRGFEEDVRRHGDAERHTASGDLTF